MLRRLILAAAPLILLAQPALAGEPPKPEKAVGQYVDLAPVGLPIVANGQVVNYVFVYVRVNLANGANASRWREKEPYFRDALVREGHRSPFTVPGDYQTIDTVKLTQVVYRDASAITGPGVVKSVVVTSQAPRWRARKVAANPPAPAPH